MSVTSSHQHGNVLLIILAAVFLVGLLTKVVVDSSLDTTAFATRANVLSSANSIAAYSASIDTAVQTILNNSANAPADLDDMPPTDANFNTAPHSAKIFHPYGGGASYREEIDGWSDIIIHTDVQITDVDTSAAEIVVVGEIENAQLCDTLALDNAPAVATQAAIDNLLAGTSVTLDEGTTCTSGSCDNITDQCLKNAGGTQWVYYHVLVAQ